MCRAEQKHLGAIMWGALDFGTTLHELAHFPSRNGQSKLKRFGCSVLYSDAGPFYRRYRTLLAGRRGRFVNTRIPGQVAALLNSKYKSGARPCWDVSSVVSHDDLQTDGTPVGRSC